MLLGLDDIDWASMGHAYGPAGDLPDQLRALRLSAGEHEQVLYWLYDRIHPDGEVFDSTVACVPFLAQVLLGSDQGARPKLMELLASVCGSCEEGLADIPHDEAEPGNWQGRIVAARTALSAELPRLRVLLEDPDPAVRREAPHLLAGCADQWGEVLPALRDRAAVESDPMTWATLILVAGRIAEQRPELARQHGIAGWLAGMSGDDWDPAARLIALEALLKADPAALPGELVPIALRAVYGLALRKPDGDLPICPPDGRAGLGQWLAVHNWKWLSLLPWRVYDQFGGRLAERSELVRGLLDAPEPEFRFQGCGLAVDVVEISRANHSELLHAVMDRLWDPEDMVRDGAAETLRRCYAEAAPLSDRVLRILTVPPSVTELPPDTQVTPWRERTVASLSSAVAVPLWAADTRDPRFLPALRWALEFDEPVLPPKGWIPGIHDPPPAFGYFQEGIRTHLGELLPLLRRRLWDLYTRDGWIDDVVCMIGWIGEPAADAAGDLATLLTEWGEPWLLSPIGRLGRAAHMAAPAIRPFLNHHKPKVRIDAAAVLWQIAGDPGPALALLADALRRSPGSDSKDEDLRIRSTELAATVGPAAAAFVPELRRIAGSNESFWARTHAAVALWRATREPQPTVATILDVSNRSPKWLITAANCLGEIGPAARDAAPLFEAELANPRRLTADGDDRLLQSCRTALANITGRL